MRAIFGAKIKNGTKLCHALVFILKTHYAYEVCVALYVKTCLCDAMREVLWLRLSGKHRITQSAWILRWNVCYIWSRNRKQHKTSASMSDSTCSCVYVEDALCICSACCVFIRKPAFLWWFCDWDIPGSVVSLMLVCLHVFPGNSLCFLCVLFCMHHALDQGNSGVKLL